MQGTGEETYLPDSGCAQKVADHGQLPHERQDDREKVAAPVKRFADERVSFTRQPRASVPQDAPKQVQKAKHFDDDTKERVLEEYEDDPGEERDGCKFEWRECESACAQSDSVRIPQARLLGEPSVGRHSHPRSLFLRAKK